MKDKIKKMMMAVMALLALSPAVRAEGTDPTVSSLWTALGVDLGSIFTSVFTALASPVGVVVTVIFVMALFYFVIRLGSKAFGRKSV